MAKDRRIIWQLGTGQWNTSVLKASKYMERGLDIRLRIIAFSFSILYNIVLYYNYFQQLCREIIEFLLYRGLPWPIWPAITSVVNWSKIFNFPKNMIFLLRNTFLTQWKAIIWQYFFFFEGYHAKNSFNFNVKIRVFYTLNFKRKENGPIASLLCWTNQGRYVKW